MLAADSVDAQHLGGLGLAQLLEVAQGQHLAVERVHAVERLLEADLQLGPDGGLARPGLVAQAAGRPGRPTMVSGSGPR